MEHRLLPLVATLVLVTAGAAAPARACDEQTKQMKAQVSAASAHAGCTAEMAAKCTPAQAAACSKAKGAAAVTAESKARGYAGCPHSKGSARSIDAAAAVYSEPSEMLHLAGSNGSCSGRGFTAAVEKFNHNGCDACADLSLCDQELKSAGSVTQVVKLKNGIMFVHTASNPSDVRAVQAAMARRNGRLMAITAAGDRARLCPDCRAMRGAIASGKLTREMVPIEGGCLTLMTSNDPTMVGKLHALAGAQHSTARIKS